MIVMAIISQLAFFSSACYALRRSYTKELLLLTERKRKEKEIEIKRKRKKKKEEETERNEKFLLNWIFSSSCLLLSLAFRL